jgi:CubicO group peptidase (beta-lactamase class C family)
MTWRWFSTSFALCAAAWLATANAVRAQATFPTTVWPIARPADVGLNVAVLDSIDREIKSGQYGYVDRVVVIARGRLVWDRRYAQDYAAAYDSLAHTKSALNAHDATSPYNYYAPWWHPFYRRGDLHTLQSVTKTITSVVIGTAVTRGEFPSIDTPVLAFYDSAQVRNIDDRKRRMTIRHLLTMTDGMDWLENLPYTDPRNTTVQMEASYDWVKFTIDRPMAAEPGTRWNYNSGASQLLADIFRKATKMDIEEYAARHLFAPIGIQAWYWKRTPAGIIDTEGGLYLEATDLARIWYLFLRGGVWNGRRVLSDEWVRASVAPAIAVAPGAGAPRYGFKWWLYPHPSDSSSFVWSGSGFGGQSPMALPREDLVIVFNAWNILPGRPSLPVRASWRASSPGGLRRRPPHAEDRAQLSRQRMHCAVLKCVI